MIQYKKNFIFFVVMTVLLVSLSYCSKYRAQDMKMVDKAFTKEGIISLFALKPADIKRDIEIYFQDAQQKIDTIIGLPKQDRTFLNTVKALDELVSVSNLAIAQRVYEALELLSPEKELRDVAHDTFIRIQNFWVEQISTNKDLYHAFLEYASEQKDNEHLSDEYRYLLNDMLDSFKREGLGLSDDILHQVKIIKNDLSVLTANFDRNIAQSNLSIVVSRDQLSGLEDDFIQSLPISEDGKGYILGVDYPTYFRVMENCANADTRKRLYSAFNNRAYPENESLLEEIIMKRDRLAHLLGYINYSYCDIDDQMAHTPDRATSFLEDLSKRALPKAQVEKGLLTKELPESVILDDQGRIMPWDYSYVENYYKKKHFNIDEQKIAEFFPMEKTVQELLDIYRQFFSIDFKEIPVTGLWHEDVTMIQVIDNKHQIIGNLLLDLYPRPNKYSHAAHTTIIPSTFTTDGIRIPDVSIVLANFSKPTETQPSLLNRGEVRTFFHEFGHALHAILGATTVASLSGTHTKTDFVELPSQMLEEWLWDKDILKKVSGHYVTGEPLSDDVIDTLVSLKDLTSGFWVLRQVYLSSIALSYFGKGDNKKPYDIMKGLHDSIMSSVVASSSDNHFYASFGHLTGYGAKYYGYLWSKVFALDLFAEIKQHGLLNPVIGQKYVKEVLSKGGAQDPNKLLYNFLGREPNAKAFFDQMGL